jgi:hypothetical protein
MDVRFATDLLALFPAVLTSMVVTVERPAPHSVPVTAVRSRIASAVVECVTQTVPTTKAHATVTYRTGQNRERIATVLALPFDALDIVHFGVAVPEELVGLADAVGTVDAFLVRGLVLELVAAALALAPFSRPLPVAVVFARVRVAVVAVGQPRLRVVELRATTLTGPVRQRLTVDFRVMSTLAGLARKRFPAGRTLGHTTEWPRYPSKTYGRTL